MTAHENSPSVELVDAAVNAWFAASPRAALIPDQQEHFRERMRAALSAIGWTAGDTHTPATRDVLAERQRCAETAVTQALHDAASSLESISTMAGVAGCAMTSMAAVRNYAAVRARIARAKLPSTYRPANQNGENS